MTSIGISTAGGRTLEPRTPASRTPEPQIAAPQTEAPQTEAPRIVAPQTTASRAAEPSTRQREDTAQAAQRKLRSERLNQLRAGVLGANDGIVSVGGLVVGVAASRPSFTALLISGLAAVVAGALSMAVGEYVSVSSQADTERSLIARTRVRLASDAPGQHRELTAALEESGVPAEVSEQVADSLEGHDALGAHIRFRYGIEETAVVSPVQAALSSFIAFTLGSLIPLLAILVTPAPFTVPATLAAVVAALAILGFLSSHLGEAATGRGTLRVIGGGLAALLITYAVGYGLGVAV